MQTGTYWLRLSLTEADSTPLLAGCLLTGCRLLVLSRWQCCDAAWSAWLSSSSSCTRRLLAPRAMLDRLLWISYDTVSHLPLSVSMSFSPAAYGMLGRSASGMLDRIWTWQWRLLNGEWLRMAVCSARACVQGAGEWRGVFVCHVAHDHSGNKRHMSSKWIIATSRLSRTHATATPTGH